MWTTGRFIGIAIALVLYGGLSDVRAYEVDDVSNGATISGSVAFTGVVPAPKRFPVEKDQEVCGHERQLTEIAVQNGRLQGAVVVLEGVQRGKPFAAETYRGAPPGEGEFYYRAGATLSLDVLPKTCEFGPFTGVVALDEPVRFLNHDPMKHVLQTFSATGEKGRILRTIHNRDLRPGVTIERTFDAGKFKNSRVVRMACNRHDFMQNWLYVVETPYYAVSDAEGRFTIDQIPPGHYELIVWHPLLGEQRQAVEVGAGVGAEANFEFTEQ
ncbi:hypothetical protein YTPLAS18_39310 [Nitrospira sp.]|nr:hypothetical protein YTPLAS18_39310 [Nitrospira sp.]